MAVLYTVVAAYLPQLTPMLQPLMLLLLPALIPALASHDHLLSAEKKCWTPSTTVSHPWPGLQGAASTRKAHERSM